MRRGQHWPLLPVGGHLTSPWSFASQIQPFFPVNAVSPLVIVSPTFPPQQDLDPRKTIPHARLGDLSDPLSDRPVVAAMFDITKHPTRQQHHGTGPPLRYPVVGQQNIRQLSPLPAP